MTSHIVAAPGGPRVRAWWQRHLPFVLAAVALLGLIPPIYFSPLRRIEYDAYWELFIATQDRWADFFTQGKIGAHPLLFHALMRSIYHLGHSRLIYRMPGMLATVGTAFLIGVLVKRISGHNLFAVLATLVSAMAGTTIEMAVSIRSYPIAVLFIVLSFYFLLRAWDLPEGRDAWQSSGVCSVALTLAILTEYFAVFYLAASFGLIALRIAFDPVWRSRAGEWLRGRKVLITSCFALPSLVTLGLLIVHFGAHRVNSTFYWFPNHEPLLAFWARSLQLELTLLTPLDVAGPMAAVMILFVAAALVTAIRVATRKSDRTPFATWAPILILLMLLFQILAGSAANRYPFGGQLRHQYVLFPFLIISFFVLAAQTSTFLKTTAAQRAYRAAMITLVGVASFVAWENVPIAPKENFVKDFADFRSAVGQADLICVDMFSLIGYFGLTHDWHWQTESRNEKALQPFTVYKATSPTGEQVRVLHNQSQWNWNLKDPVAYALMAEELRGSGYPKMSLFYLEQIPDNISWTDRKESIERLADAQGLRVEKAFPLPKGMGAVFSLK